MENGGTTILRKPINLKHSYRAEEIWVTMRKNLGRHIGLKRADDTLGFFTAVEDILRKLIYNQFVVGFRPTYNKKDYLPLTLEEKRIVKAYFPEEKHKDYEKGPGVQAFLEMFGAPEEEMVQ